MSEYRSVLEHAATHAPAPDLSLERVLRRRDRKRRNQRITAGVGGIAVFVAVAWIVTGGFFDRAQMPMNQPTQTPTIQPTQTPSAHATQTPASAVGAVPETDYLLDLNTGHMTPLPRSIGGRHNAAGAPRRYVASPDGSRLAYADRGEIFIANLDGTGIEQVTHDLEAAFSPTWSPDGSKIAYIRDHDDRLRDLFVLDLATGASTQLTFATHEPDPAEPDMGPWDASSPSFAPDGASIVYGAARESVDNSDVSEAQMRIVPVAGGKSVRLMNGVDEAALSPDGSLLAYAWRRRTGNCVCVSNTDGTGERILVQGTGDAINGTPWSPDGTRIAYFEFHSNDVAIVDVATGQTTHVGEGYWPTWVDDHTLLIEMDGCYDPTTGGRVVTGCAG